MLRCSRVAVLIIVGLATACVSRPRGPLSVHDSRTFPASESKLVRLELRSLDAVIRVQEGSSIAVDVDLMARSSSSASARRWIERNTPVFDDSPGELRVHLPAGRRVGLSFGFLHTEGKLSVTMPSTCKLEVATASGDVTISGDQRLAGAVRINTTSGDVTVTGGVGELVVDTTSGDVRVKGHALDVLQAETTSGDVRLDSGAAKVLIDTSSGDVRLDELTGSATIDASSGDVAAHWARVASGERVRVDASSGDVSLTLPVSALSGEAQTSSGRLRSTFEGERSKGERSLRFSSEKPDVLLEVRTSSGNITLRRRSSD